jgi:hypothetical protein
MGGAIEGSEVIGIANLTRSKHQVNMELSRLHSIPMHRFCPQLEFLRNPQSPKLLNQIIQRHPYIDKGTQTHISGNSGWAFQIGNFGHLL